MFFKCIIYLHFFNLKYVTNYKAKQQLFHENVLANNRVSHNGQSVKLPVQLEINTAIHSTDVRCPLKAKKISIAQFVQPQVTSITEQVYIYGSAPTVAVV